MKSSKGSLIVVGCGIKSLAHLSTEAISAIKQADIVLYSVNEPILINWIKSNNTNTQSLDDSIDTNRARKDNYETITSNILSYVKQGNHVCVVFYGHPTVFASSALMAAKKARENDLTATILPAISAEDCLFADLLIDPGSHGCQSYETTDMIIRKRTLDPSNHVILWQAGMVGSFNHHTKKNLAPYLTILENYLLNFYSPQQSITAYEASLYPHLAPRIEPFLLKDMTTIALSPITSLYIPPAIEKEIDEAVLKELQC
jgi:tetrapyrrole methylase family protein/MazG family protein